MFCAVIVAWFLWHQCAVHFFHRKGNFNYLPQV